MKIKRMMFLVFSVIFISLNCSPSNVETTTSTKSTIEVLSSKNNELAILLSEDGMTNEFFILQGNSSQLDDSYPDYQVHFTSNLLSISNGKNNINFGVTGSSDEEMQYSGFGLVKISLEERVSTDKFKSEIQSTGSVYKALSKTTGLPFGGFDNDETGRNDTTETLACFAGGEGSKSCTIDSDVGIAPARIPVKCSVSCGEGYYSCCGSYNPATGKPNAKVCGCIPEKE